MDDVEQQKEAAEIQDVQTRSEIAKHEVICSCPPRGKLIVALSKHMGQRNCDSYQKSDDPPQLSNELTQPDNFFVVITMPSSRGVIFQLD